MASNYIVWDSSHYYDWKQPLSRSLASKGSGLFAFGAAMTENDRIRQELSFGIGKPIDRTAMTFRVTHREPWQAIVDELRDKPIAMGVIKQAD